MVVRYHRVGEECVSHRKFKALGSSRLNAAVRLMVFHCITMGFVLFWVGCVGLPPARLDIWDFFEPVLTLRLNLPCRGALRCADSVE